MTEHYEPPNTPLPKEAIDYLADSSVARADSSVTQRALNRTIDCYRNTSLLRQLFGACSVEEKAADDASKKANDAFKKADQSWQKVLQLPPWFTNSM